MAKVAPIVEDSGSGPYIPALRVKPRRPSDTEKIKMEPPVGKGDILSPFKLLRNSIRQVLARSGWYDSPHVISMRKFLRGKYFTILAMFSLFLALFLGELFQCGQVPTNVAQDSILSIVFAIFLFEFIGLSLTDPNYIFGFFFWMDLLGTASMLMDISYMYGSDATQVSMLNGAEGQDNVIVVRAARAAKLGARAGRLSRVLKILRFLPFLNNGEQDHKQVKMAKVISNQLNIVLSTRVAFLTICIVVVLPVFNLFIYPETDDSMSAWAELLNRNAEKFRAALLAGNSSQALSFGDLLESETIRFVDFYSSLTYGPFFICYGEKVHHHYGGSFDCKPDELTLNYASVFSKPRRLSNIRQVDEAYVSIQFDMSTTKTQESASGIVLICFIVVIMSVFGMLMSKSIAGVALVPLERMLNVVR
ncbi:unnamed protein product, partial [Polarella glacialis]